MAAMSTLRSTGTLAIRCEYLTFCVVANDFRRGFWSLLQEVAANLKFDIAQPTHTQGERFVFWSQCRPILKELRQFFLGLSLLELNNFNSARLFGHECVGWWFETLGSPATACFSRTDPHDPHSRSHFVMRSFPIIGATRVIFHYVELQRKLFKGKIVLNLELALESIVFLKRHRLKNEANTYSYAN